MQQNSDKVVISSGVFIISFMLIDALLNSEYDKVPREIVGGLVLILFLSTFQFVGLGRIAGPFAALIAGTVFLTRGGRIYGKLATLSETTTGAQSGGTGGISGIGNERIPEHQQG